METRPNDSGMSQENDDMKASINAITKASLRELASVEAPWCATLLMPAHRAAPENRQDPIRLKNLLQRTEELLVERGVRSADARDLLAPVAALVHDTMFWSQQQGGLGFYFWPHGFREFRVPVELPEKVLVTETPWLLPLLPLANDDARFFVLAISGESVRLLEASRYGAADRDLPGAPQGMEDLARFIEEEKQLQFHTGAAPADNAGNRAAVFHGHGGDAEREKRNIRLREYCQAIDESLMRVLAEESAPLVLAADEPLMGIFRDVCSYRHLLEDGLPINPDELRPAQLQQEAWQKVEPTVKSSQRRTVDVYREAVAHDKGTDRLEDVLRAGSQGRIASLMVDGDAEQWGKFEEGAAGVELHQERKPDDQELVNLAAAMALKQSADVFAWPSDDLPTCEPVAAVLRY